MINPVEWPLVGSLKAVATLFTRVCADRETGFNRGQRRVWTVCVPEPKPALLGTGAQRW